jgi:pimeloyl-ACP methyl ester carboxylesterase
MKPPLPELSGVEHEWLDLPTGVRVHVAHAGPRDAPPVLALHGWPQHWWAWRRVIPLLAADHHVICPDNRGFGWSGPPADNDFTKDRLADDALAVLDALSVPRARVVGHDWGGWVGFRLALRAPERVDGLLALSVAHPWQPPARTLRNAWRLAYQPPLATPVLGPALARDRRVILRVLRTMWGDRATRPPDAEFEPYLAALTQPEQADASSRLYRSFLTREAAAKPRGRLTVPTRLMIGRLDPLGVAWLEGLHGATEIIEGAGHLLPEERPELVAERLSALQA